MDGPQEPLPSLGPQKPPVGTPCQAKRAPDLIPCQTTKAPTLLATLPARKDPLTSHRGLLVIRASCRVENTSYWATKASCCAASAP